MAETLLLDAARLLEAAGRECRAWRSRDRNWNECMVEHKPVSLCPEIKELDAARAALDELAPELSAALTPPTKELARNQPCGCVVCRCEDEERCGGCGAKNCGTHPVGQIPNPVYKEAP